MTCDVRSVRNADGDVDFVVMPLLGRRDVEAVFVCAKRMAAMLHEMSDTRSVKRIHPPTNDNPR